MVKVDLQPVVGRDMAGLTGGCRSYMGGMFTGGSYAIVAGLTAPSHAIVVEIADIPTVGCMAGVAGCIG